VLTIWFRGLNRWRWCAVAAAAAISLCTDHPHYKSQQTFTDTLTYWICAVLYTLFCSTGTVKGTSRGWGSQKFFKNWASSDVLQRQIKESEPYKYRELMANLGTHINCRHALLQRSSMLTVIREVNGKFRLTYRIQNPQPTAEDYTSSFHLQDKPTTKFGGFYLQPRDYVAAASNLYVAAASNSPQVWVQLNISVTIRWLYEMMVLRCQMTKKTWIVNFSSINIVLLSSVTFAIFDVSCQHFNVKFYIN